MFLIFDSSEVGSLTKHKIKDQLNLSENIILLRRSDTFIFDNIKISYLNGFENSKFLSQKNIMQRIKLDKILKDKKTS
jgi:hypothetical protein